MTIGVAMIVKNEERFLNECLSKLADFDEIVIVDTGSEDNTVSIAKKYTNLVFEYKWCDNFSKARNFSLSKCSADFVLILDGDEIIEHIDMPKLREIVAKTPNVLARIKQRNIFDGQDGEESNTAYIRRFFTRGEFHYEGHVHEQVVPNGNVPYKTIDVPVCVVNWGNKGDVSSTKSKGDYYFELLKAQLKDEGPSDYVYYQLGQVNFVNKNFQAAIEYFEKALSLCNVSNIEWHVHLVTSYCYSLINVGKFDEATFIGDYFEVLKDYSDYLFAAGYAMGNIGLFEQAIGCYQHAIDAPRTIVDGSNSYKPNFNIGLIYELNGQKELAIEYYKKCGDYPLAKERWSALSKASVSQCK